MSTKVFVGNLVFSTTGDELKAAFSPSAPVLSANIITRGRRSLGYGFVEFATEAEAEKAVAEMDKKEIAGRPINAQVARPRDPAKEAEVREKRAAARAAKPRQPRAPKAEGGKTEGDAAAASSSSAPSGTDASPSANGGRRGGRRGGPRNAAAGATDGSSPARRGGRNPSSTGGAAAASSSSAAPRRQREPQEQRPASETTLFVANVPFSTDDAQLRSFFAEHNPKSAHVVRMRNGRSRGYGFVEFDTADGQKAGLAVDGKEVSLPNGTSLKLSVKIAMTPPPVQASDASAAPVSETPK
jgi:RNA recognition motif-containing protein